MHPDDPDRFLESVNGVIHVGANTGHESELYASLGLNVFWIEPIPEVFDQLIAHIAQRSRQRAVKALITDVDDATYEFNVCNNNGGSSSLLDLKEHRDIWPKIEYTRKITLTSTTLCTLLEKENVDRAEHDALVMDTQGSEMLVLKGAEPILREFRFIKSEVADFESYVDCCQLPELDEFMARHGFQEFSRLIFARHPNGGKYYDVTYRRLSDAP